MIYDGFKMSPDEGTEEFEEVQASLRRRDEDVSQYEIRINLLALFFGELMDW